MFTKLTIQLPDIRNSFRSGSYDYSNATTKTQNVNLIKNINSRYGSLTRYWGQVFDIPSGVIIGFIATESGGQMLAPNKYLATGLMQVTPAALFDCARKWGTEVKIAPLPVQAVNGLKQKIPNFFTATSLSAVQSRILVNLQSDANFNIMAGTIVLRWLIERFSIQLGQGQLNKAMVAYNAGAYRDVLTTAKDAFGEDINITKIPVDSTTLATNRRVPIESRNYLLKMLGKDGFLELIYLQKLVVV